MKHEPKVGDRVINLQTDEKGKVTAIDETGPSGGPWYQIRPVNPAEDPYWEAIWNLEVLEAD